MKPIMKMGLAVIMLIAISCTKENNTIRSSTVTQSTDKALTFHIGQHYGGGIIFYIDSTGQHGLIADTVDLKPAKWWNPLNKTYTVTGAVDISIGAGKSNTKKIILSQGDSGIYAARRCWNYKGSGYKDWFLPSIKELNELYLQRAIVGGFANTTYWSSSELSNQLTWQQIFTNGRKFTNYKYVFASVRAVRAF